LKPRNPAEEECKDQRHKDGLQNSPRRAQQGLFVADFDITPSQKEEQFAKVPQLLEIQWNPLPVWFNDYQGLELRSV
jgi:hypothetical protein